METSTLRPFRTPIRGHMFSPRPPGAGGLETGQPVRLVREPGNPADHLAVGVWLEEADHWRIGYLDRGVAARVAPRLDGGMGLTARLEGWTAEPEGRWQRPLVLLVPATPGTLWRRPPGVTRKRISTGDVAAHV